MDPLYEDFLDFHEANPHVYRHLVTLCRQARDRGIDHVGIGMLFEVMRWNRMIHTDHLDYKLNNNHRAFYARLIMDREPDLRGVFETRAQLFHLMSTITP